jgi:membrane-associated phospholipid phosphatase
MLVAIAVFLAAAMLSAFVARKVVTNKLDAVDRRIRQALQTLRTKALDLATKPITILSLPLLVVSATAALAWWLHRTDHNAAAIAIAVTPILAAITGQSFTMFFPQHPPPNAPEGGAGKKKVGTFPSGHTTGVTAEAFAFAYILHGEQLVSPVVLAVLLAWPFVVGVTRLYRDRHWFSDVLAGWIAGVGVASISVILYLAIRA